MWFHRRHVKPRGWNKAVFNAVCDQLGAVFKVEGYVPHPSYRPGWERTNQEYSSDWLNHLVGSRFDMIAVKLLPKDSCFRVVRTLFSNTSGISTLEEVPAEAGAFTDMMFKECFREYTLLDSCEWWKFSAQGFCVRYRQDETPQQAAQRVVARVLKNLPSLLEADKPSENCRCFLVVEYGPFE